MSGLFQTIPNNLVFSTGNQSIAGIKSFTDTTASTSTTTGTTFAGGVGISGALNVGSYITCENPPATENSTKVGTTAFSQSLCRPAFFVASSADQTTSADIIAVFNTEIIDTNNAFSVSSFVAPIAGSYVFGGAIYLVNLDTTSRQFGIAITVNGNAVRRIGEPFYLANQGFLVPLSITLINLLAADIVQIKVITYGQSFSYQVGNLSYFLGFRLPI